MRKVIDVEENIFNGVSSQCNNTASSVEGSKGKLGPCFSGKLLNYYNSSCNNKIDSQITSIATELQNLSLSIKASLQAYQETDENLAAALDSLIDDIFESEYETIDAPYEVNNETTPMCLEEREQYLYNLIKSYKEVLDSLKSEFTSKYKDDCVNDIDPKTYAVLDTLMTCFIKGGSFEGDGGWYNPKTNSGSYTISQLKRFTDFVKENSLPKKMDSYFSGKSWDKSGMDDFNRLIISNLTEPGYISLIENFKKAEIDDCVEASFLGQFYYNLKKLGLGEDVNCMTLGGNISNLLNGGTSNIDKEEVAKIKNIMSQYYQNKLPYQTRFDENTVNYGMFDYVNARVDEYNSYTNDMETITATIYNYEQASKLLPYQSYLKDIEFKEFFENDFQKDIDKYYKEIGNDSKYLTSEEIALYAYLSKEISLSEAQNYLKALTDKINNAKGLEQALNFIIDRDKEGMDLGDIFATMFTGEVDGVSGFFEGIGKLLNPTQPRTSLDYKMYYLMAFLSNPKEFGLGDLNLANSEKPTLDAINGILDNLTLSDTDKQIIEKTYNIFYGAGNMLVPQLIGIAGIAGSALSSNPAVAAIARKISMALLGASAAGRATNTAVLEGHDLFTAYVYGGITGASEALFEKLGGVIGIGDDVNLLKLNGWNFLKGYIRSMGKEGGEEFFQEYFDAGIRALVLGEPFDLGETTRAALVAGLYGMAVAGVMNSGTIVIKVGGKLIRVSYADTLDIDYENLDDNDLVNTLEQLEAKRLQKSLDIINKNNLHEFENLLDYIHNNNLSKDEAENILDASIKSMTDGIENDSGKIVKIYSELMKLLHYDEMFNIKKDQGRIESQMTLLDMKGKDIICTEFSTIFADLLSRAGIDGDKIKLMRQGKGHGWIEVELEDGRVLIADATNSVSGRIDLTSGKAGLDFVGLVILDSYMSGTSIRDLYLSMIGQNPDPSLNIPEVRAKAKEILQSGYASIKDVISAIGELNIGEYEVVASLVDNSDSLSITEKMKLVNDIKDQVDMSSIEWLQIIRKIFDSDEIIESRHEQGSKKSWAIIRDSSTLVDYKIEIINGKVQIYQRR